MWRVAFVSVLLVPQPTSAEDPSQARARQARVDAVLDDWHKAAASANEERYFGHLAPDGVFLGTDATERWTCAEFRRWAKPHFAKGKGWTFKPVRRHVTLSADGAVAWFDEQLESAHLGPCRGSGVLVWTGQDWKIAQYNLSVPIPNEAFADVKKVIETALKNADKQR
jgi:hypothetical protein